MCRGNFHATQQIHCSQRVGLHNEYFTADAFVLLLECMIATCDTTIYCNIATFAEVNYLSTSSTTETL